MLCQARFCHYCPSTNSERTKVARLSGFIMSSGVLADQCKAN